MAIFPNVCLWRRSLCSNLAQVLTLKNCIEPFSYASTAYVVASALISVRLFWAACNNFLGKWFTAPLAKNSPYAYGKELIFRKKDFIQNIAQVNNIPKCTELPILSVRFQANCKYSEHARAKLIKANKYLFVLRSLLKEGFQSRWPNFTYGLSVYGAVDAELTVIQNFLDRYFKRKYTSKRKDIRELLKRQMRSSSRYVQWIPIARS